MRVSPNNISLLILERLEYTFAFSWQCGNVKQKYSTAPQPLITSAVSLRCVPQTFTINQSLTLGIQSPKLSMVFMEPKGAMPFVSVMIGHHFIIHDDNMTGFLGLRSRLFWNFLQGLFFFLWFQSF